MTVSAEQFMTTLREQHQHIKTLMEAVVSQEGSSRELAFAELCGFLAAHEAAEEECIHPAAKGELVGDTGVVDQRVQEEHDAGEAIEELERLGTGVPEFRDKFEKLRQAVIGHAEAEEHEEVPKLLVNLMQVEMARMHEALSRVPDLAAGHGANVGSFAEQLQAARAEFRSWSPTAR